MSGDNGAPYGGYIYARNDDDPENPGGLKVRWKVRVATGAEARRADEAQRRAILALLAWAERHPDAYRAPGAGDPGNGG